MSIVKYDQALAGASVETNKRRDKENAELLAHFNSRLDCPVREPRHCARAAFSQACPFLAFDAH